VCDRVRRDGGDAVTLANAELGERGGRAIAALEELRIGQAQLAIHHCLALRIQLARATREFHWSQRRFQIALPSWWQRFTGFRGLTRPAQRPRSAPRGYAGAL
jgi:hypothetical protein